MKNIFKNKNAQKFLVYEIKNLLAHTCLSFEQIKRRHVLVVRILTFSLL